MKLIQLKPLTLGLMAACLLVAGGLVLLALQPAAADAVAPSATSKPALTVTLTQARAGTLPIKLTANGNLAAWQEASIGAEASGLRVQELLVQVGDRVQRGQLLARFAPEPVQAEVALARAALSEATANAAEAAANADRARAVQGTGALSAQQINVYLTQELTAKARVESAKAQLDTQLLRLSYTRVLAPDAGIISSRSATVGAVLGAGTEMFRLIRQGRLEWRAELTSSELSQVAVGTPVLVTAPGGAQTQGRVRMVAPTVDAQTRNGLVYVDLAAPKGGSAGNAATGVAASFKPGMFARGEFALGSSSAMTLPHSAVLVRDGFSYVMRVGADNKISQRKVQTGRRLGEQVEILAGVAAEDRLVASGVSFLTEGDLVRVVDASATLSKEKSTPAQVAPGQAASN
ncbi:efflux RND transporter periplasmic adaptor subunit [Rhodoferax fermentans]|uniref:Efflux transporter periplasmic adaptor subunit n=1 Tax=Rhodoferax fermentans TaxID=28066 RepID=A0A1T1AWK0_RHOFE|nr:efflux RND transporter periplasmic adaptor subunit [Rhodoferax fermentans]MBK1684791.1 efflux RND transporter periplasmic adaptor subunit [Rhodoferax fermentans]OOV08504.1 efflux transporter periplasmic adaptor subunit [Rhodoferax fermentans]